MAFIFIKNDVTGPLSANGLFDQQHDRLSAKLNGQKKKTGDKLSSGFPVEIIFDLMAERKRAAGKTIIFQ